MQHKDLAGAGWILGCPVSVGKEFPQHLPGLKHGWNGTSSRVVSWCLFFLSCFFGCILHLHNSPPQTKAQSIPTAFLLSSFPSFCEWGVICFAVFIGNWCCFRGSLCSAGSTGEIWWCETQANAEQAQRDADIDFTLPKFLWICK